MSYTSFVIKFENGEPDFEPFDKVNLLLSNWGVLEAGNYGLEVVIEEPYLFSVCSLTGNRERGISGITFERPQRHPQYYEMVFELLSIPNSCHFGTDMEFVYSRTDMNTHYPAALIENTEATVITELERFKTLMHG